MDDSTKIKMGIDLGLVLINSNPQPMIMHPSINAITPPNNAIVPTQLALPPLITNAVTLSTIDQNQLSILQSPIQATILPQKQIVAIPEPGTTPHFQNTILTSDLMLSNDEVIIQHIKHHTAM